MSKRMLINAVHPEECRIAIAEEDRLLELEVERANTAQLRGNIYKAEITRVEPSLQAAFLDIGSERNGFLQINDINPTYFQNWNPERSKNGKLLRPSIQDVLNKGQQLVVQVVKDSRDAKGATLTTNLSLPGRYLVLMVGNQRGGVSRKIQDEGQRHKLKQAIERLTIPAGMGAIVRTAGINKTYEELNRDLEGLIQLWHDILLRASEPGTPKLLYQESGLAVRTIRDYLTPDIEEILIDDRGTYEQVHAFIEKVMPHYTTRVRYYDEPRPLFSKYHLDRQVDAIGQPEVTLPSGGSIVINVTEAVVAIDVNSGRSTSQSDVEETAFNTNKEAVAEVAKQLRLRDLGGLIVIDLIDMWDKRHKHVVEKTLKESVRTDRAKIEMGRISKFGLLEMSRQRLKASLVSQSHVRCPHCGGGGWVKTADAAALEALQKIQSSVYSGGVSAVRVRMAPAAALFLLNNKRRILAQLEEQTATQVLVYADGRMRPDEYQLELETGGNYVGAETSPGPVVQTNSDSERGRHDHRHRNDRSRGHRGNDRHRGGRDNRSRDGGQHRHDRRNEYRQGGPRHSEEPRNQPQGTSQQSGAGELEGNRSGEQRHADNRHSDTRQGGDNRHGENRQSDNRQGRGRGRRNRRGNNRNRWGRRGPNQEGQQSSSPFNESASNPPSATEGGAKSNSDSRNQGGDVESSPLAASSSEE